MHKLRRYFVTGLLIILPAFVTLYLLFVIFRFIDSLGGRLVNSYLNKHWGFIVPGLGFILGALLIVITGFLATNFLGKKILPALEKRFLKLPFIRQIYPAVKEITKFFFSAEKFAFKKVVLVEYPSKDIWSVAFVTNEGFKEAQDKTGQELVHVFIGSTPSPFSGFFVLVPKSTVKFLDISVEDAVRLIVSGGIIKPE